MKLSNCAKAATILLEYFPEEWIAAEHDIIYFAPPGEENFNKVPPEVRKQLEALGIHYNETDGFYGYC